MKNQKIKITIEGPNKTGKSLLAGVIQRQLVKLGIPYVHAPTAKPGGGGAAMDVLRAMEPLIDIVEKTPPVIPAGKATISWGEGQHVGHVEIDMALDGKPKWGKGLSDEAIRFAEKVVSAEGVVLKDREGPTTNPDHWAPKDFEGTDVFPSCRPNICEQHNAIVDRLTKERDSALDMVRRCERVKKSLRERIENDGLRIEHLENELAAARRARQVATETISDLVRQRDEARQLAIALTARLSR